MASSSNKISVGVYRGKCPVGGCANKHGERKLGKGYSTEEPRRRVFNHLMWSPHHANYFESEQDCNEFMDQNVESWCEVTHEEWDADEFQQWQEENREVDAAAMADAADDGKGADNGATTGANRGADKGKCKSKDKAGGIARNLEAAIQQQTKNMMHFTRAVGNCINALKLASQISKDAAACFDRERANLEDGAEEMISAFGLAPGSAGFNRGGSAYTELQNRAFADRPGSDSFALN